MKAAERLARYGAKAYAKMRGIKGKKALKEISRLKRLYPTIPVALPPKAPYISRTQRSYWADVKILAKERDMSIKDTRTLLKKLKTSKNVQVRVIKEGAGWQFILFGKYEHWDKEEMEEGFRDSDKKHEIKDQIGYSYVHYTDEYYEEEEEAFEEAKNDAKFVLGGTGWTLIKVLKETWVRFFGREE